jgi:hypothetical protein
MVLGLGLRQSSGGGGGRRKKNYTKNQRSTKKTSQLGNGEKFSAVFRMTTVLDDFSRNLSKLS